MTALAPELTTAQADALVQTVVDIYTGLEDRILSELVASLAKGSGTPTWKTEKLSELAKFKSAVSKEVAAAGGKAAGPITQALLLSEKVGRKQALIELRKMYPNMTAAEATKILNSATRIQPLVKETVTNVVGQHAQILRSADDIYRSVVTTAASGQVLGVDVHKKAVQNALDKFAANGVSGFVDKSGKKWDLESYTKMALHTAVHRASIEGHVNGLKARGQTLVYVSNHLRECPLCRPWEGKILSTDYETPVSQTMAVATLRDAQAAGFMHPFCRHTVGAYFPGVTQLPDPGTTADPAGSEHRTKLRALERTVRYWERRQTLATTPQAKAQASAKVKEWKGQLKDHKAAEPHPRLNYAQSQAAGYAPPGKPPPLATKPRRLNYAQSQAAGYAPPGKPIPLKDRQPGVISLPQGWEKALTGGGYSPSLFAGRPRIKGTLRAGSARRRDRRRTGR